MAPLKTTRKQINAFPSAPARARWYLARRTLVSACCAAYIILSTGFAIAGEGDVQVPDRHRPETSSNGIDTISTLSAQYLLAIDTQEKGRIIQALADAVWSPAVASQRGDGRVSLSNELLLAWARDLSGSVPQAWKSPLVRIFMALDAQSSEVMNRGLLTHLSQIKVKPTPAFLLTALRATAGRMPGAIYQAIRETDDPRVVGDLAQVLRGAVLPAGVKEKLVSVGSLSQSNAIRIQIAQTVGPEFTHYGDVMDNVIKALDEASSDEERQGLAVTLGDFPSHSDAGTDALIRAFSHTESLNVRGVIARIIAESGARGLLYLAQVSDAESDPLQRTRIATMMAVGAGQAAPLPDDVALPVIHAVINARLDSKDPLLRSSSFNLFVSSGQSAIAPLQQGLKAAKPGQARADFQEALNQLSGKR